MSHYISPIAEPAKQVAEGQAAESGAVANELLYADSLFCAKGIHLRPSTASRNR